MSNFKQVFESKRELLSARPEKARVTVSADSQLVEAFRSVVKIRDFEVVVDQQKNMDSTDLGPKPSEYVLAALAACHEVTYRLYADAMDIPLNSISVSVEGVSDARGFFGLEDNARAGFEEITGTINIDSPASDEDIERLREAVNRHCPVLDDLQKPVSVVLNVKRN